MARPQWLVVLAVLSLGVGLMAPSAMAQMSVPTSDNSLHSVGASDTQASFNTGWVGVWSMGQFGFALQSWGRAPVRSGYGRTSVAVLRERRGLLR